MIQTSTPRGYFSCLRLVWGANAYRQQEYKSLCGVQKQVAMSETTLSLMTL